MEEMGGIHLSKYPSHPPPHLHAFCNFPLFLFLPPILTLASLLQWNFPSPPPPLFLCFPFPSNFFHKVAELMFLWFGDHCVPLLVNRVHCRSNAPQRLQRKCWKASEKTRHPKLTENKNTDFSLWRSSMARASASSAEQTLSSVVCNQSDWAMDEGSSPPQRSSGSDKKHRGWSAARI